MGCLGIATLGGGNGLVMNAGGLTPMLGLYPALETPVGRWQRQLRENTGRGVKIGILDTGVADRLAILRGAIRTHHTVADNGRLVRNWQGDDVLGHGTACAWVLKNLVPDAELHQVRIFGRSLREPGEKLLAGLDFAIDQGWDIINVSLGTAGFRDELFDLAARAADRGIVIVAAAHNEAGRRSFPAELPNVIGVDAAFFDSPLGFRYQPDRPIEVEANGIYVRAPWPNGRFSHFTGSSFACPHLSAIVARLGQGRTGEIAVRLRTQLEALSQERD